MTTIDDRDRDSLHVLALQVIPLKTPALQRTRMIKNHHLESVVEVFDDSTTGSGQVAVDGLHQVFSSVEGTDVDLLKRLAGLGSYDVYSLRIALRKQGIQVDEGELRLSEGKQRELDGFMRQFTRPLLLKAFGAGGADIDFREALSMFRDPDVRRTLKNLREMASMLDVSLDDLPMFLEEFGDIVLSTSYFRHCLSRIEPTVRDLEASLAEIRENHQCKSNPTLIDNCRRFQSTLKRLRDVAGARFVTFTRGSQNLWRDMDAERFKSFKSMVLGSHTILGSTLCALDVKMDAWTQEFPNKDVGSPVRRADFILTDMKQGLERLSAPATR